MEERIMDMFSQLSVQIGNMTARMDHLEREGQRSHARHHVMRPGLVTMMMMIDKEVTERMQIGISMILNYKFQPFRGIMTSRPTLNRNERSITFSIAAITVGRKSLSWQLLNYRVCFSLVGSVSWFQRTGWRYTSHYLEIIKIHHVEMFCTSPLW